MANRLRTVLGEVISKSLSAFVFGRLISDNVIIRIECLHSIQTRKRKKRILDVYSRASGQVVNYDKSALCVTHPIPSSEGDRLATEIGVRWVRCHECYLGFSSFVGRNKQNFFDHIKDCIWKKLKGWRSKLLSTRVIESIQSRVGTSWEFPWRSRPLALERKGSISCGKNLGYETTYENKSILVESLPRLVTYYGLKVVRTSIYSLSGLRCIDNVSFIDFFSSCLHLLVSNELELLCVALWRIWYFRNQWIHGGELKNLETMSEYLEEF
ncbi:hypothetical protein Ddye_012119 [Dipteronia dyeriana]|uniref:Uncharacterized protein n=1 Tax=Dipteronia dyeriana TaxID=168575 RepID=A0AAD9X3Q6_9ROSI|nr:hypothetical protein Ddye_012119 [Dipteronia dyeriana]